MARGDLNSSQASGAQRGDAITDRQVEATILRVLVAKFGLSERLVQQIQELAGERGDAAKTRAAVRRADLADALGRVPVLSSKPATAAPTAAEYNALRDDVRRMYEALSLIAQALRGK